MPKNTGHFSDSKFDERLLDKRVVQRNVVKKLLTEEEYKSYLLRLKDESAQCEPVRLEDEDIV
ncbi:MAG: hypothetical protein HYY62_07335 [Deltaproteobacteria bacterium]|nr:hypothetical protein [Deltaproteobacteria bacterium]